MLIVKTLPRHEAYVFEPLYRLLNTINIPIKSDKQNNSRRGFGTHRSMTFGIVSQRYRGFVGISAPSMRHTSVFNELLRLASVIAPDFAFTTIHVNKNVVCPHHTDSTNIGESMLVSFGEYDGCELLVENVEYDTKYRPVIFNGSKLEHWNNNTLVGSKYSLVYFTSPVCKPTL